MHNSLMSYLESSQQPFPAGENLYRSVLVGVGGFFVKGKDDTPAASKALGEFG